MLSRTRRGCWGAQKELIQWRAPGHKGGAGGGVGREVGAFVGADPLSVFAFCILHFAARCAICHVRSMQS